jgi:putative ABC transport system permease protein
MLWNYLKIAYKVLLRRKFFTFASLFAITFTLAVLVVVAALVDRTFGPVAPETRVDRSLGIFGAQLEGPQSRRNGQPGYKLLDAYARDLPGVERMSIFSSPAPVSTYHGGERVKLYLKYTDADFWNILEFTFLEGRPFTPDEDRGGSRVAVVNAATRDRLFGGASALGRTVEVEGRAHTVVGVVDNVSILRLVPFSDVWVPTSSQESSAYKHEIIGPYMAVLLARSADDFPAIKEEFATRIASAEIPDPRTFERIRCAPSTAFEFLASQFFGDSAGTGEPGKLVALGGLFAFLFMLLPAANLVNINVSRIMERASEIGVRRAFGASSRALVAQFLVENVAVTVAGGVLALAVASAVLRLISSSRGFEHADLGVNYRVFLYGLAAALVFGVVSGIVPAWKMSRLHPVAALKGGSR